MTLLLTLWVNKPFLSAQCSAQDDTGRGRGALVWFGFELGGGGC